MRGAWATLTSLFREVSDKHPSPDAAEIVLTPATLRSEQPHRPQLGLLI